MTLCQSNRHDGERCSSPAVTGSTFCHFHGRILQQGRNPNRETPANLEAELILPDLTDPAAILAALSSLVQAIATNRIDPKRANLMLRGLSLAARLATAVQKHSAHKPQQIPQPVQPAQETLQPPPAESMETPTQLQEQPAATPLPRTQYRPQDRLPRSLRENLEARRQAMR